MKGFLAKRDPVRLVMLVCLSLMLQTPATVEFAFGDNPNYTRSIIKVPKNMVGLVIGKGGETIKRIGGDTGAKVQFDQGSLFPCLSSRAPHFPSFSWFSVHLSSAPERKKTN